MKKFLFFICLLILFGMCIYPPWQRVCRDRNIKITVAWGHAFIWDRPEDANIIDYGRLGIQALPVILAMFLLFISTRFPLFPANKKPESNSAVRKKKWNIVKFMFLSLVLAIICAIIVFLVNNLSQSEGRARHRYAQYSALLEEYSQLNKKYQALQTAKSKPASLKSTGKGLMYLRALAAGCSPEEIEKIFRVEPKEQSLPIDLVKPETEKKENQSIEFINPSSDELRLETYGPSIHSNQYGQPIKLWPDLGYVEGEALSTYRYNGADSNISTDLDNIQSQLEMQQMRDFQRQSLEDFRWMQQQNRNTFTPLPGGAYNWTDNQGHGHGYIPSKYGKDIRW